VIGWVRFVRRCLARALVSLLTLLLMFSTPIFAPTRTAATSITTLPYPALTAAATSNGDAIVVGSSPSGVLWYQESTNGVFGGWQSLPTTDAASQPATVVNGSTVYVFFRASDNELHYFEATPNVTASVVLPQASTFTWTSEQNLGGVIAGNPVAAVDGNGRIIVVALNSAGNVFTNELPSGGSWTGWIPLDGILAGQLSLATLAGNVYLFGLNSAGLGWTMEWIAGTTNSWGSWVPLGGVFQSGTTLSAASDGTSLHVQGVNSEGILFESTGSGTAWSGWTPLDGVLVATPSVVATSSDLFVFGTNGAGELWTRQFTGSWQAWTPLGGILATAPIAVGSGANAFIFALASDGSLWYVQWNGTSFGSWTDLGGVLATA
jgi:hypothetical protein